MHTESRARHKESIGSTFLFFSEIFLKTWLLQEMRAKLDMTASTQNPIQVYLLELNPGKRY